MSGGASGKSVVIFAVAIVTGAAIVVAGLTLRLRGDEEPAATPSAPTTTPAPLLSTPMPTLVDAESAFIAATADHICKAQSQVYESPEALAAAYQAAVEVPGLSPEQASALQARLTSDPAFSERLATELSETCRPGEMQSDSTTTAPG